MVCKLYTSKSFKAKTFRTLTLLPYTQNYTTKISRNSTITIHEMILLQNTCAYSNRLKSKITRSEIPMIQNLFTFL